MDTSTVVTELGQKILEQIFNVFASGTLNIMIVIGMTVLTQVIKRHVYWISKRILLFPIFLATGQTVFSYFIAKVDLALLPLIWFGYLGGSVLFYVIFKKWKLTKKFFGSNYRFLEEKENERKEKNAAKKTIKKSKKSS